MGSINDKKKKKKKNKKIKNKKKGEKYRSELKKTPKEITRHYFI